MNSDIYIPPENRDTRWPLWFKKYQVRIPHIQMLSIEEIEDGLPTSGDEHHDHASRWEPRHMLLPVHRLAELWGAGANIHFVKSEDTLDIYNDISAHLNAWKNHIQNEINYGDVPADDLLLLDQFANSIYEHAKFHFDDGFTANYFGNKMASRFSMRANRLHMEKLKAISSETNRFDDDGLEKPLVTKNIKFHPAPMSARAKRADRDFSGQERVSVAPTRRSMSDFFRKTKE